MKNITQKSITIFMSCLILLVSIIIIIVKINSNHIPDYTVFEKGQTDETVTIQSEKIGLDTQTIEKIWNNSSLEGNKKDKSYYRFEFPVYRGESENEAFSLFFRFYVSCEDGENYLDPRVIFGGYYNISDMSDDDTIRKNFVITSGKEELQFEIFKDEKKEAQDGNAYSMMAFSTNKISELEKICEKKKISLIITLDEKEYKYKLTEEERKKLKALVSNYVNLQRETGK